MRFKLLVFAAFFSLFAFVIDANAQRGEVPEGLNFRLSMASDIGWRTQDDDRAAKSYQGNKGFTSFDAYNLGKGANFSINARRGNVTALAVISCGAANYAHYRNDGYGSYSTNNPNIFNGTQVTFFYLQWESDFGFGFRVGKDLSPANMTNNLNFTFNGDRFAYFASDEYHPFVTKLFYKGFYVAGVYDQYISPTSPNVMTTGRTAITSDGTYTATGDTNGYNYGLRMAVMVPKTVVGYVYGERSDPIQIGAHFQYFQYTFKDREKESHVGGTTDYSALVNETVRAWRVSADFIGKRFAGMLDVLGSVYYGINAKQLGFGGNIGSLSTASAWIEGGTGGVDAKVKDATTLGGHAGVAILLGEHKLALAAGYETTERKDCSDSRYNKKDDYMAYGVSFWYALEQNLNLVPTYIMRDYKKDFADTKEGKEQVYGVMVNASI